MAITVAGDEGHLVNHLRAVVSRQVQEAALFDLQLEVLIHNDAQALDRVR